MLPNRIRLLTDSSPAAGRVSDIFRSAAVRYHAIYGLLCASHHCNAAKSNPASDGFVACGAARKRYLPFRRSAISYYIRIAPCFALPQSAPIFAYRGAAPHFYAHIWACPKVFFPPLCKHRWKTTFGHCNFKKAPRRAECFRNILYFLSTICAQTIPLISPRFW